MNRRLFLQRGTGTIGVIAFAPYVSGCSSEGTAEELASVFIASASAIVNADPSAPYVGDLDLAITAMKTAQSSLNLTSLTCAFETGAQTAVSIIDEIAPNSPEALIATVALAGFAAVEPFLPACTSTVFTGTANALRSSLRAQRASDYNEAKTGIQKAWFPVHAYRSRFNAAAKKSGLTVRI